MGKSSIIEFIKLDIHETNKKILFLQLNMQGWLRRLTGDKYAIGILNVSSDGSPLWVNKTMMDLGLPPSYSGYTLTEVFSGKQYGHFSMNDRLTVPIPPTTLFLAVASPSS